MTLHSTKIRAESTKLHRVHHEFNVEDEAEIAAANELLNALASQFDALSDADENPLTTLSEIAYYKHTEGICNIEIFSNSSITFDLVMYGVNKILYGENFKDAFDVKFKNGINKLILTLRECYRNDERLDIEVREAMRQAFEKIDKPLSSKTLIMNYFYMLTQTTASDSLLDILRNSKDKVNDLVVFTTTWFNDHEPY